MTLLIDFVTLLLKKLRECEASTDKRPNFLTWPILIFQASSRSFLFNLPCPFIFHSFLSLFSPSLPLLYYTSFSGASSYLSPSSFSLCSFLFSDPSSFLSILFLYA
ncbi:hypothetical protein RIF29_12644 [Crotalaria pallida]|uniref:Uncharacterized protein n=1 Tax=Crotalaria pallida TaxID=3830 RepID=A0AAN9P195_CROPI